MVNHIPINIALESRYLRQRIAKLLEKEKKYRVYSGTILRIMRRRNQYYIQIGLGKEIREFNIKMRDNIEIENHLFGKVYKIGENSIYVNLDDLGHISKGQIVDFKKTSEVTIIQSQREALAYFSENENVNFRLFKECLFRNNDIPNNKNSSLNFENQSLNPAQKEAVERALPGQRPGGGGGDGAARPAAARDRLRGSRRGGRRRVGGVDRFDIEPELFRQTAKRRES